MARKPRLKRFQSPGGPMKVPRVAAALATALTTATANETSPLQNKAWRAEFVRNVRDQCVKVAKDRDIDAVFTLIDFDFYCTCIGQTVLETLTADDLAHLTAELMRQKGAAAVGPCIQRALSRDYR